MRRLSLFLVFLLVIALTVTTVCAADSAYYFDLLPDVQTLPIFSPVSSGTLVAYYEGFIPAGEYECIVFSSDSEFGDIHFDGTYSITYSPMSEYDGHLGCHLESFFYVDGVRVAVQSDLIYYADDGFTYLFVDSDSGMAFNLDDRIAYIAVPVDSGDGSSSGALKDFVIDLFGPYEQRTETITETLADGSTVTYEQRIPGIAGLDYEWIASVVLFGLALLSFFRILGGLIKQ